MTASHDREPMPARRRSRGPLARKVRLFFRQPRGPVGLALVLVFVFVAVFAPLLAPFDPLTVTGALLQPPSLEHPFGTDSIGKDLLSSVLYGARPSLVVGVCAAALSLTLGVLAGSVAGYFGGVRDSVIMRIAEIFQVLPSFVLALVIVAMIGGGTAVTVVAIGVTLWPQTARIVRAEVMRLKQSEFVPSARAAGFSNFFIIRSEVVPNAMPAATIQATLDVGLAVLIEAGLSFLGLGDPSRPSWGELLNRAQPFLATAWWWSIAPGVCIFLLVLSFNLVGDAMNGAMNPKRRPSKSALRGE